MDDAVATLTSFIQWLDQQEFVSSAHVSTILSRCAHVDFVSWLREQAADVDLLQEGHTVPKTLGLSV